jgi:beta-glucanase (GH16 family)
MKQVTKIAGIVSLVICIISGCSNKGKDSVAVTPKMSFDDISILEGTNGVTNVEVKLKLDRAASGQLSVTYSTIEGTAKGGNDFTAVSNQSVSFQPNETEKTILISVVTDDIKEADETFQLRVENPVNVILLKGTAAVTLRNDDTKIGYNNAGYVAPTSYPGFSLTWGEEFNGPSLDGAAWSNESGDGCPALCSWGNNELQYYTAPPNNLFFQDGKMIIEARAETFGGKNYTSARIKTAGKKTFKYGRIDIRAILPKGKGIWPAFWLLPQNSVFGGWPRSGEIDLMELVGHEAGKTHGTIHYGPGPGSTQISRNYTLPGTATFNDEFHVFSFEWKQDQMKWLVDGNLYSTINKTDLGAINYPFNEDFYFIVNLAVGGNWPGAPDAATTFPQWLIVDYIRVYQQ